MDFVYYIDGVQDELSGAEHYIKKAVSCKKEHPEWATLYADMSKAELGHAQNLIKIFEDEYKQCDDADAPIYKEMHDSVMDMYTNGSAKVKMMHQVFSGQ